MPRDDNAAVLAAQIVDAPRRPGPPRLTADDGGVPRRRGRRPRRRGGAPAPRPSPATTRGWPRPPSTRCCDPMSARASGALLRDTVSPNIIHAGVKYNVIPGEATVELDCRLLPGTTEEDDASDDPSSGSGRSSRRPATSSWSSTHRRSTRRRRGPLYDMLVATRPRPRPGRHPGAVHGPVRDRRQAHRDLGVPTYGFSPLRLDPDETFLERFHGVDERVGVDAPALGPARPVRRRPPLLRLNWRAAASSLRHRRSRRWRGNTASRSTPG